MKTLLIVAAIYLGLVAPVHRATAADSSAPSVAAQTSRDRGVTVIVTPINLARDAATWEFKVVLDTHSQELSEDLQRSAVLVSADGRQQQPIAWVGAPAGGHHREGILRFAAITPAPEALELRLQRPNEAAARTFRWQLR